MQSVCVIDMLIYLELSIGCPLICLIGINKWNNFTMLEMFGFFRSYVMVSEGEDRKRSSADPPPLEENTPKKIKVSPAPLFSHYWTKNYDHQNFNFPGSGF